VRRKMKSPASLGDTEVRDDNLHVVSGMHVVLRDVAAGIGVALSSGILDRQRWKVQNKNRRIPRAMRQFVEKHEDTVVPERESIMEPEVLIPCFNQGVYMESALSSINQSVPITVINDASTDRTAEELETLSRKYAIKVISNDRNLNQAGSLNRAISESSNNLFIILNADDCFLPYTISATLSVLEDYPSVYLSGGGAIPFSRDESLRLLRELPARLSYTPKPRIYSRKDALTYHHLNDLNMTMSGCAFFKSAWRAAGGFREFRERVCSYDDRDFQMRVSALVDVGVVEEPLALYRVNSSVGKSQS